MEVKSFLHLMKEVSVINILNTPGNNFFSNNQSKHTLNLNIKGLCVLTTKKKSLVLRVC